MRGKDLFEAMAHLEDKYIEEAEQKVQKNRVPWRLIASAAACFVCVGTIWTVAALSEKQRDGSENQHEKVSEETDASEENQLPIVAVEPKEPVEVWLPGWIESFEFGAQAITEEDMMQFNQQWQKDEETLYTHSDELEYYTSFIDARCLEIFGKSKGYGETYVTDSEGWHNTTVVYCDGSMSATYLAPHFDGEYVDSFGVTMRSEKPEYLENAFSEIREKRGEVERQLAYIQENLTMEDYAFFYYDNIEKQSVIQLVNEQYREQLERQGIVCEMVEQSCADLYGQMEEIWKSREELEIFWIYISVADNALVIDGLLTEEAFAEKVKSCSWADDIQYEYESYGGLFQRFCGIRGAAVVDEVNAFVEYLKGQDYYDYSEGMEEYFEELETALQKMKEKYPEYTCLQLYYHISVDCDYENYMKFDLELENFVNSLPAYKIDKNFMNELAFADPQRLGLKQVLRQAKMLYPEKTYQELYDMYPMVQKIEETTLCSKADAMFHYLYLKASQKELLES